MKVNFNRDGMIEFTSEITGITFSLTESEAWEVHRIMERKKIDYAIRYNIEDFDDWCFELSQEEVLNDAVLMSDLIEDAVDNNIDFDDSYAVYDLLQRYLDIKFED